MKRKTVQDLKWEGNSKAMHDAIINSLPPLFKAAIKKKLDVYVDKHDIEVAREDDVINLIQKYVPEQYKEKFLSIAEDLKTK